MNDEALAIIASAWIAVLSKRDNQEGYTDGGAGYEAARMAIETAKAIEFFSAKERIDA